VRRRPIPLALAAWLFVGWALPASAGQKPGEKPKPSHWSDALKGIPLGPFRLDIGGSVRLRYEARNDFSQQRYADDRQPGYRTDHFVLQRTRVDFDLHLGEDGHAFVQIQDARAHDSDFDEDDFPVEPHSCPFWNPFDLRLAYVEWRHIGDTPFGIKVGRQAIFYADNRVWGPGEWGNVGRYTWDAVKLIVDTECAEIHGIFGNRVRNDPHSFDEHNQRLDAFGVYAMVKKLPCRLDLFWVGKRSRPEVVVDGKGTTVDLDTHTVGFYLSGKLCTRWDYAATLARTCGDRDGSDVEAYGANARLGYTFDLPWQPRLGVEYSFASGDPNPGGGDYETFDGVFGAIDRVYGRINFFSWMNLQDYQASFSCRPIRKAKLSVDYHFFRLDEDKDAWYWCSGRPARQDATGNSGSDVGQEIDLIASYAYSKHLKFMTGYAHFFPGPFIERTGTSPDADWFFFQTHYFF